MKRCPQCNRLYSDMTEKCPQCGVSLSGDSGSTANVGAASQQPRNDYHSVQDSRQQQNVNQRPLASPTQNGNNKMGFGEAVSTCFRKYVDPNGRARRSEYWYFLLFSYIVSFSVYLLDALIGTSALSFLATIVLLCPSWCVMVRRYHDTGKKWTFLFWVFVPFYGLYKTIAALSEDSEPGANMYGSCPKR